MAKINEIYKCGDDGVIVELLSDFDKELSCGDVLKEKTEEEGFTEKHKPVIEEQDDGAIIKIGSVPHPMEEEHYIEWVEVITDKKLCRYRLRPGDKPEVRSSLKDHSYVRIYCNVHGLWRN